MLLSKFKKLLMLHYCYEHSWNRQFLKVKETLFCPAQNLKFKR